MRCLKLLLLLHILLASGIIKAQNSNPWSVGASCGIDLSNVKTVKGFPGEYHLMCGYNASVILDYQFQNNFSIQTQLGFMQTGFRNTYQDNLNASIDQEIVEFETSYLGHEYQNCYNKKTCFCEVGLQEK